jgi:hypothetical protein
MSVTGFVYGSEWLDKFQVAKSTERRAGFVTAGLLSTLVFRTKNLSEGQVFFIRNGYISFLRV